MSVTASRVTRILFVSALSINSAMALPIDWTGVFGVDTHLISNIRRTSDDVDKATPPARTGTQGIDNGDTGASFQTYVFKLNPQIIVNDGVTLKGEFSTGYIRGGFAGGDSANSEVAAGNNAYFFTTPANRSELNINQMYMELYADTALVKIGRMSRHYGLGMIFDSGNDPWDRFLTIYDGIEAEMKIGNFSLIPHFAKISSFDDSPTAAAKDRPSGTRDVREMGLIAKYDNKNRDLVASILYAKRSSERLNSLYTGSDNTGAEHLRGKTEVTVLEPFVSKKWNKFKVAAEASIQTGDYGDVYDNGENAKLSANAYMLQATYDLNPKWDVGFIGGQLSGDKGETGKFEATYLHPNFQVAELMFRYHYQSFTEGGRSIFDSSMTNARFYKLFGNYKSDKWTWKGAFILASALETASANSRSYHHEENYSFTSTESQADDYGYEFDFGFDYRWNPNVTITGHYGYWFVGDYYAFNGDAEKLSVSNVHGGGLRATLEF